MNWGPCLHMLSVYSTTELYVLQVYVCRRLLWLSVNALSCSIWQSILSFWSLLGLRFLVLQFPKSLPFLMPPCKSFTGCLLKVFWNAGILQMTYLCLDSFLGSCSLPSFLLPDGHLSVVDSEICISCPSFGWSQQPKLTASATDFAAVRGKVPSSVFRPLWRPGILMSSSTILSSFGLLISLLHFVCHLSSF